ncbi:hypothetical protein OPV22_019452 [Ensete ventricosum]|uniref:Uncharacterized protein n=1 Tax=Ensete ventricosum TaxID=4639 RepID=A0AAV8QDU9_ENSVE|nr:hypothetical protein OPV22_019452 [Ensete ventricosum]
MMSGSAHIKAHQGLAFGPVIQRALPLSTLRLPPSASVPLRPSHWIDHGGAAPTNLVKVRDLVRVGIDSGRALVLDSKLLGRLLKGPT